MAPLSLFSGRPGIVPGLPDVGDLPFGDHVDMVKGFFALAPVKWLTYSEKAYNGERLVQVGDDGLW